MLRHLMIVLLFLVAAGARADNWPAWRGPTGDGITTEKGLPVHWAKGKNVRWQVELQGAGVSQPVVWGERIFLTASTGRLNDQLHVSCYHRADGKLLWHTRLFGTAPTDLYAPGGMAVPTPAADGKHLYCLFGTGDLACLDFDGRPVWIRSLAEEYGPFRNRWGMGASPILVDGLLVVQVDHWSQSYLLAIDPATGANRWKTNRDAAVNWTSPLAVKVKGRTELIVLGTERAKSYDSQDGRELWTVEGLHQQCIPTAVASGDLVFLTSGVSSMAVRLDGQTGDVSKSHVAWVNKRAAAFLPSPVVHEGRLYVPGDRSFVTCLDAASGQQLWKERLGEQFHASPVAGDGKIYFVAKEGVVRVVRAGSKFELLAENDMGEEIIASPAISDGELFLRGQKHLFCISAAKK